MWKLRIGISIDNKYSIPLPEVLALLKKTGFDSVSPSWSAEIDLSEVVNAAREQGLSVQAVHGPYRNITGMWSRDVRMSDPAKSEIFKAIEDCGRCGVPIIVSHVWIGFGDNGFNKDTVYFDNFDEMIEVAKKNNVMIAFENTEGEEYLDELMEHYKDDPTVGFCWDSGHEMCYNHSADMLGRYGDRLIMTHLNDNLGISRNDGEIYWTDDLHLLPYDGVGDWDYNIRRLKASRKMDMLNFELNNFSKGGRHDNDIYAAMPLEIYFAEAYKRACRIAYRYSM